MNGSAHGFSLHGAWTRQSVSIDGSEPFETQRVYWLQAGPCYADVRVPFHPPAATSCFSGRSGWDGERYRWTHQLDLGDRHCDDVGDLTWEGGRLVEKGSLGSVAYQEVWVPLPDGEGAFEALEGPHGCHVQVGAHAITISDARPNGGSFNACYRVRTRDGWQIRAIIGDGAAPPGPGTDLAEVGAMDLWGTPPAGAARPRRQRR